jgi:hypothetical protein
MNMRIEDIISAFPTLRGSASQDNDYKAQVRVWRDQRPVPSAPTTPPQTFTLTLGSGDSEPENFGNAVPVVFPLPWVAAAVKAGVCAYLEAMNSQGNSLPGAQPAPKALAPTDTGNAEAYLQRLTTIVEAWAKASVGPDKIPTTPTP